MKEAQDANDAVQERASSMANEKYYHEHIISSMKDRVEELAVEKKGRATNLVAVAVQWDSFKESIVAKETKLEGL